jgi:hypothetical protein
MEAHIQSFTQRNPTIPNVNHAALADALAIYHSYPSVREFQSQGCTL